MSGFPYAGLLFIPLALVVAPLFIAVIVFIIGFLLVSLYMFTYVVIIFYYSSLGLSFTVLYYGSFIITKDYYKVGLYYWGIVTYCVLLLLEGFFY